MTSFKHPSKLVDRVRQQIHEHKVGCILTPWQGSEGGQLP